MEKRYVILSIVVLIFAGGLLFLPEQSNQKEVSAEILLRQIEEHAGFITTDEVADIIINQDPTLLLVDLRDSIAYNKFSIEGAINIPFAQLLDSDNIDYYDLDELNIVLYDNTGLTSESAWLILRRKGYTNITMMEGGLYRWAETIINPKEPSDTHAETEHELYSLRKAASMYFTGASKAFDPLLTGNDLANESKKAKKKKVIHKKKHKKQADGGC